MSNPHPAYHELLRKLIDLDTLGVKERSFLWDIYSRKLSVFSQGQKAYLEGIARRHGVGFIRPQEYHQKAGDSMHYTYCSAEPISKKGEYQIVDYAGVPQGYPVARKDALYILPWFNSVIEQHINHQPEKKGKNERTRNL